MSTSWLCLRGVLEEDVTTNQALIDSTSLTKAATGGVIETNPNPQMFNYVIQITNLGGATGVDIDVLGPGGLWSSWATGKVVNDSVVITSGWWRGIRLTWTGGVPDGDGEAHFEAARKFNGLA